MDESALGVVTSEAKGVGSVGAGGSGRLVGLTECLAPRCIRAGLGRVFPRCSKLGPSVSRGIVGRSTS